MSRYSEVEKKIDSLQKRITTLERYNEIGYGGYGSFGWNYSVELKPLIRKILEYLQLEIKHKPAQIEEVLLEKTKKNEKPLYSKKSKSRG